MTKFYITSFLVSLATIFISFVIFFNISLPIVNLNGSGMLGSTITTINGSDKIKDLPATINANFTALNNDKIETSTTSSSQSDRTGTSAYLTVTKFKY